MKIKYILSFLFLIYINNCFGQNLIAKKQEGDWILTQDYVILKEKVLSFFKKDSIKPNFHRISIQKNTTIGEKKETYYCIIFKDTIRSMSIVKSLQKIEHQLYSSNKTDFQKKYQICEGIENCSPNVAIIDGKRYWGCGETLSCEVDRDCKSTKLLGF